MLSVLAFMTYEMHRCERTWNRLLGVAMAIDWVVITALVLWLLTRGES